MKRLKLLKICRTTIRIIRDGNIIELYKPILNSAVIYVGFGYGIITYIFCGICQSITTYNVAIISKIKVTAVAANEIKNPPGKKLNSLGLYPQLFNCFGL